MKILNYTPVDHAYIKGMATVEIKTEFGMAVINKCKVVEKNDKRFVNAPQFKTEEKDGDGRDVWRNYIDVDDKKAFSEQFFKALDAYLKPNEASKAKPKAKSSDEVPF